MQRFFFALAAFVGAESIAAAKSDLPPGNYIVYYAPVAASENGLFLIKVEHKGGKDIAEMLFPKQGAEVESIAVDNRKVMIVFKAFGRTLSFDGTISEKDAKDIIGSFGDDNLITRGRLVPTDKDALDQDNGVKPQKLPEEMTKALQLSGKLQTLRRELRETTGDDARAELRKQIDEAQKDADEQLPGLYKEVLSKHPTSPAVVDAVLGLLAKADKNGKPAEVAKWLKTVDAFAEPFGSRYRLEILTRCLNALETQKGFEAVALATAEQAAGAVNDGTTAGQQIKVLKALTAAQEKAGKGELAKQTAARVDKLEDKLDQEYLEKVPPFKPAKFQGRKEKSEKVAVLELFTGAQCPPCVAADAAFDGLLKAYKPSELVLIQYHMHIPGPDPLTNPDTVARWDYYRNKIDPPIRGVPTALLNGKTRLGVGGGMDDAETRFKEIRAAIDPLLEETTTIKLKGDVAVKGDALSIKVDVDGVKDPGENLKLRLVLVEESIRYLGGNGIRFHHHVVRDMPGGVDGISIREAKASATATVDLANLRSKLGKYLDDFVANEGSFSNPSRPLALKNLRVIALVQNDRSAQILQALQLNVPESK